jgi:hypothetical protein
MPPRSVQGAENVGTIPADCARRPPGADQTVWLLDFTASGLSSTSVTPLASEDVGLGRERQLSRPARYVSE